MGLALRATINRSCACTDFHVSKWNTDEVGTGFRVSTWSDLVDSHILLIYLVADGMMRKDRCQAFNLQQIESLGPRLRSMLSFQRDMYQIMLLVMR